MKNRILISLLAVTLLAGAGLVGAQSPAKAKGKPELVQKTGTIAITKADVMKKEKFDTILLKVDKESFKLLPGKDKKVFKTVETFSGKTVTVTGELLPADKIHPLAAIKVVSITEVAAPAAPAPAAEKK